MFTFGFSAEMPITLDYWENTSKMISDMKDKPRNPVDIISQIQGLLSDLSISLGSTPPNTPVLSTRQTENFSGPSGGIRLLVREEFFVTPKTRVEVVERLRQEGFNYPPSVISVALLRQVRSRELVRLPSSGKGKEKWAFAERK